MVTRSVGRFKETVSIHGNLIKALPMLRKPWGVPKAVVEGFRRKRLRGWKGLNQHHFWGDQTTEGPGSFATQLESVCYRWALGTHEFLEDANRCLARILLEREAGSG